MRLFFSFTFFLTSLLAFSQNKEALIIANSNYDSETTGWGKISAYADIKYIVDALHTQGFSDEHITVIEDADKATILSSLEDLKGKLKEGYSAVIHYSGHGQQVSDKEGEEIDGLDEALVPIDAPVNAHFGGEDYQGEKHITDDELGAVLNDIRTVLGEEGHLVMLMDACHSGTGSRGGTNKARGTSAPYIWKDLSDKARGTSDSKFMDEDEELMAKFVLFSGSSAHQLNYETRDDEGNSVGSLSYAFAKACGELEEDYTYRQLFAKIQSIMAVKAANQDPLVEGDVDYKMFNGDIVPQTTFYLFEKKLGDLEFLIDGGYLTGLTENSVIGLYPAGISDPQDQADKLIVKGKVVNSGAIGSTIKLDEPTEIKNLKDYYIFLLEKNLDASKMTVKVDNISRGSTQLANIKKSLLNKSIFEFTESENADIILSENEGKLYVTSSDNTWTYNDMASFSDSLQIYAEGSFLKKLNFDDRKYQVSVNFIPVLVELNHEGIPDVTDTLNIEDFTTSSGIEFPVGTSFLLEVENTGIRDAHFAILDIQPNGVVGQVLPYNNEYNPNASILPQDCFIRRGDKRIIEGTFFQIGPPYGLETYKILAAEKPINTQAIVTSRGKTGSRSGMSSLELLVKDTYGTRGSTTGSFKASPSTGSAKNVHFKIVK